MPFYAYKCEHCEEVFEIFHGMDEQLNSCIACESENTLVKIPAEFLSSLKKEHKNVKIGSVVESYIKDAKKEISKEKKNLKKKTHD